MTDKFNAGKLTVWVRHSAEYFNTVCQATIPEYWEAEVELTEELLNHLHANNDHTHMRIYGTSQDSRHEAIQDLIDELKRFNITGSLKIK